jgi:putative Ca2+/H+ antiporter (TMEM165/GDT1 family)
MTALLASFGFIFAAEMGDKTQLVALAFATRYNARTVLIGVTLATLLVHLFSVFVGVILGSNLPAFWISIAAGLAFIGFGLWTLRGDKLDEGEEKVKEHRFGPIFTVGLTFFLAELGDKTMLATITLSSQYNDFVFVWLGSTLGMVAADGLAVILGTLAGKRLPEKLIKIVAGILFIAVGIFTLVETIFLK